ncbi:hypothetical protein FRC16_008567 [Serendipita sp. 398]|nr:hypothetical protein FRC16_008567 [Serendipita sp. 398]
MRISSCLPICFHFRLAKQTKQGGVAKLLRLGTSIYGWQTPSSHFPSVTFLQPITVPTRSRILNTTNANPLLARFQAQFPGSSFDFLLLHLIFAWLFHFTTSQNERFLVRCILRFDNVLSTSTRTSRPRLHCMAWHGMAWRIGSLSLALPFPVLGLASPHPPVSIRLALGSPTTTCDSLTSTDRPTFSICVHIPVSSFQFLRLRPKCFSDCIRPDPTHFPDLFGSWGSSLAFDHHLLLLVFILHAIVSFFDSCSPPFRHSTCIRIYLLTHFPSLFPFPPPSLPLP